MSEMKECTATTAERASGVVPSTGEQSRPSPVAPTQTATTAPSKLSRAWALGPPLGPPLQPAPTLWPPAEWLVSMRVIGILVVAFGALTAAWSGLGLVIVNQIENSWLHQAETDVSLWFERMRTPTLNDLTYVVSVTGDSVPKTFLIWGIAILLVLVWRRLDLAMFLLITLEFERAVFGTTASIVGRLRPPVEQLDVSSPTGSFPSGHLASATALAGVMVMVVWQLSQSVRARKVATAVAGFWVLLMAVLRLYRGMHYLTDVVAGILLGFASLAIGCVVLMVGSADIDRRRRERRLSADAAPPFGHPDMV